MDISPTDVAPVLLPLTLLELLPSSSADRSLRFSLKYQQNICISAYELP